MKPMKQTDKIFRIHNAIDKLCVARGALFELAREPGLPGGIGLAAWAALESVTRGLHEAAGLAHDDIAERRGER